mmetsp:Transcript_4181/g.14682  ORF Transcript_4181/g.14682 Transcript_4181/m.14682 type:complete len:467 (-) Transcript_4181:431-1831(-)
MVLVPGSDRGVEGRRGVRVGDTLLLHGHVGAERRGLVADARDGAELGALHAHVDRPRRREHPLQRRHLRQKHRTLARRRRRRAGDELLAQVRRRRDRERDDARLKRFELPGEEAEGVAGVDARGGESLGVAAVRRRAPLPAVRVVVDRVVGEDPARDAVGRVLPVSSADPGRGPRQPRGFRGEARFDTLALLVRPLRLSVFIQRQRLSVQRRDVLPSLRERLLVRPAATWRRNAVSDVMVVLRLGLRAAEARAVRVLHLDALDVERRRRVLLPGAFPGAGARARAGAGASLALRLVVVHHVVAAALPLPPPRGRGRLDRRPRLLRALLLRQVGAALAAALHGFIVRRLRERDRLRERHRLLRLRQLRRVLAVRQKVVSMHDRAAVVEEADVPRGDRVAADDAGVGAGLDDDAGPPPVALHASPHVRVRRGPLRAELREHLRGLAGVRDDERRDLLRRDDDGFGFGG